VSGQARLILICGLPGSGKTTLAKGLESTLGAVRLNADEWMEAIGINLWDERARARIEALQWRVAKQLLQLGNVVVIEWGTWARSERDELRIAARALGAAVELHYLAADVNVLAERLNHRRQEDPPITRDQLSQWLLLFESPTPEELALYDEPPAGNRAAPAPI